MASGDPILEDKAGDGSAIIDLNGSEISSGTIALARGGTGSGTASGARSNLGLGSAAIRSAEDTLTNGSNLPDGAAIKAYGDANWATGSGSINWYNADDYGGGHGTQTGITGAIAAAQSAGGGVVYIPAGTWTLTSTITVSSHYVHLQGDGAGATILYRASNYGDTLVFHTGATSPLYGCSISNMLIRQGVSNMTSTHVHVKLYYVWNFRLDNMWIKNGGRGIQVYGQTAAVFITNSQIELESGFSGYAGLVLYAGSYSNTLPYITMSNVDMYPSTSSNAWTYGILIQACDGFWANNVHVGRATNSAVAIIPSNNTTQISGLKFVNCWFDNDNSTQSYSVYISGTNNSSYPFGIMNFIGCNFQGYYTTYGFFINSSTNAENIIVDSSNFYDYVGGSLYLGGGRKIVISNNRVVGGASGGVYNGLAVSGATNFVISGNSIGYQHMSSSNSSNAYGIYIAGACGDYIVTNNNCYGNSTGGVYDGGTGNKVVTNNLP